MLRLTKAIREKLLQQNAGFTRSTYYDSKNFEEKRIYKIIDGVLHIHEEGRPASDAAQAPPRAARRPPAR